jgi:hypothetical protein
VIFGSEGKVTAVASIGRDRENLEAELALECGDLPWIRWHSTERVFCDFGNVAVTNDDY